MSLADARVETRLPAQDDIEGTLAELRDRGAWFRDSEGNLLGLVP